MSIKPNTPQTLHSPRGCSHHLSLTHTGLSTSLRSNWLDPSNPWDIYFPALLLSAHLSGHKAPSSLEFLRDGRAPNWGSLQMQTLYQSIPTEAESWNRMIIKVSSQPFHKSMIFSRILANSIKTHFIPQREWGWTSSNLELLDFLRDTGDLWVVSKQSFCRASAQAAKAPKDHRSEAME